MALIDDIKLVMRISASAFDTEITDLIEGSKEDLRIAGVLQSKITAFEADPDSDPTLKRAVTTYVKAEFGWNNPDRDDFRDSYDMQKARLTLVQEYISEVT